MNEKQKRKDTDRTNFIGHFLFPFFFFLSMLILVFEVRYELVHRQRAEQAFEKANERSVIIKEEITQAEQQETLLKKQFLSDTGLKSSIIFCFQDFEKGTYSSLIELMDSYGYPGVIVFQDDNLPGMKGGISKELYEELLAKGWEGAIATSKTSAVCEVMGEIPMKKWKTYMQKIKDYFEENGLAFPNTYILRSDENISGISDCMEEYGITNYTILSYDVESAGVEMSDDAILNIGMIKAGYNYTSLADDVSYLTDRGSSVVIRIKKVESSAPNDSSHTSLYRIRTYLETLSSNSQVMVTTFGGYRAYREELAETEPEKVQTFLQEWEQIKNCIQELKQENKENYRQATLKYR